MIVVGLHDGRTVGTAVLTIVGRMVGPEGASVGVGVGEQYAVSLIRRMVCALVSATYKFPEVSMAMPCGLAICPSVASVQSTYPHDDDPAMRYMVPFVVTLSTMFSPELTM